jgi:hypothetical protein
MFLKLRSDKKNKSPRCEIQKTSNKTFSTGQLLSKFIRIIQQNPRDPTTILSNLTPMVQNGVNIYWFPHQQNSFTFGSVSQGLEEFLVPVPFSLKKE